MEKIFNYPRPKGLADYVLRMADRSYLIFDRKAGTKYCTAACSECLYYEDNELEHDIKLEECVRKCGLERMTVALEKRYGRKKRTERGGILWFRKAGSVTYAQLDDYAIDYTETEPKVEFLAWEQYRFSKKEQVHITRNYWHFGDRHEWYKRETMFISQPRGDICGSHSVLDKLLVYCPKNGFGGDLKYASLDGIMSYDTVKYLSMFLKYPWVEMLQKGGASRMLNQIMGGLRACLIREPKH